MYYDSKGNAYKTDKERQFYKPENIRAIRLMFWGIVALTVYFALLKLMGVNVYPLY